jgi:hypothetical protein
MTKITQYISQRFRDNPIARSYFANLWGRFQESGLAEWVAQIVDDDFEVKLLQTL